jgi:hypothetical protein
MRPETRKRLIETLIDVVRGMAEDVWPEHPDDGFPEEEEFGRISTVIDVRQPRPVPNGSTTCRVIGCDSKAGASGYCDHHRMHVDPEEIERAMQPAAESACFHAFRPMQPEDPPNASIDPEDNILEKQTVLLKRGLDFARSVADQAVKRTRAAEKKAEEMENRLAGAIARNAEVHRQLQTAQLRIQRLEDGLSSDILYNKDATAAIERRASEMAQDLAQRLNTDYRSLIERAFNAISQFRAKADEQSADRLAAIQAELEARLS